MIMQKITTVIGFSIIATELIVMSLISIQNITPISLKFLVFQSIEVPFGILFGISVGLGLILGAMLPFVKPVLR